MFVRAHESAGEIIRDIDLPPILFGESGYTELPFKPVLSNIPSHRDMSVRLELTYITDTAKYRNSERLSLMSLHAAESQYKVSDIFRRVVHNLVVGLAPNVYELDPRIGCPRTEAYRFRSFPAFDRPDGLTEIRDTIGNLMCSMCDRAFSSVDNPKVLERLGKFPVWSGGNFLWTHPSCHQKIYGPLQT